MPLYRAVYLRAGKPRGITFSARNPAFAAEYAYSVIEALAKSLDPASEILTVKPAVSRRAASSLH